MCEPVQSKRMSRFHKSHFLRKFTGKMPQPRTAKISQEPLYTEIYRKKCRGPEPAKISQEPLYTKIYRKNAGAQYRGPTLCASLRSRNACQDFIRATLYRIFTGKMPPARVSTLIKHRCLHLP